MSEDTPERMSIDKSENVSDKNVKRYVKGNIKRNVRNMSDKTVKTYVRRNVRRERQKICQKECQKERQKICQKRMSKDMSEVMSEKNVRKNVRIGCQKRCQKICQKRMSENMSEKLGSRQARQSPEILTRAEATFSSSPCEFVAWWMSSCFTVFHEGLHRCTRQKNMGLGDLCFDFQLPVLLEAPNYAPPVVGYLFQKFAIGCDQVSKPRNLTIMRSKSCACHEIGHSVPQALRLP